MGKPSSGRIFIATRDNYLYPRAPSQRRGDSEAARSHGGLGVAATTTRTRNNNCQFRHQLSRQWRSITKLPRI